MKKIHIPIEFYLRFWLTGSIMATATGLVVGYLMPAGPLGGLIGAIFALLAYQVPVFNYFWGKRRGVFEYKYREDLLKKSMRKVFIKVLGRTKFYIWYLDQLSEMPFYEGEMCQKILMKLPTRANTDLAFPVYIMAAKIAERLRKHNKAIEYLEHALSIEPYDLVANFKLAENFEYAGLASEAISSYEAAAKGPSNISEALKGFVLSQIERVRTKGPRRKPPITGFRRITW